MTRAFDAIVIGAGQAGPPLAERLALSGMKVALVERSELGGTCVNDGCTPTKTMIASARVAHVARRAADFGILTGPVRVDLRAVVERKDAIVQASRDSLAKWLDGIPNLARIKGSARFAGARELDVGGILLSAPRIFINTGGRPIIPDWPGIGGVRVLTSHSILELDRLPEHLIVVGGSYIGLEFAQMFRRFGSRVTVVEAASHVIAREDVDVASAVRRILEAEGVEFHCGADNASAENTEDGVAVKFMVGKTVITVEGSDLLFAVGRAPNTEDLGLAAAGVRCDTRGFVEVDDQLRTNVPGIWALGDVNGRGAFTHTSYNDFEIVAANLLDGGSRRVTDRITTYGLFTDPPLGRVGMTETAVRASGRPALKAVMPMARVGRARERGETQGFMKVLVDVESEMILGAAMLGIEGDEVVQTLLDAMTARTSYQDVAKTMRIHPTVAELVPTLLQHLVPLHSEADGQGESLSSI